jgi:hypothetical protein
MKTLRAIAVVLIMSSGGFAAEDAVTVLDPFTVKGDPARSNVEYLTSPAGMLEEAIAFPGRKPLAQPKASAGFQQEMEFWMKKVGKVSQRWPLELLPRGTAAGSKRE